MPSNDTFRIWIPKTSASSLRSIWFLAVALSGLVAAPLVAQGFQVSGHVRSVRRADTIPLASAWVVLHQVSGTAGGPVDSGRTDADGEYLLRAPRLDSASVYLVSVNHQGINYFGSPVRATTGYTMDTSETVFVFDTSSVGDPLTLAEKHVVVRSQDPDGSRPVLELLVLENRTGVTRVSPDTITPVWEGALPPGVLELEVGESDFSPGAITRRGDSVAVTAPVAPGEKQLVYAYTVPAGDVFRIPIDQPVARLQLLLEDTAAAVLSPFLDPRGMEQMDVARFARYEGTVPVAGGAVEVRFSRRPWAIGDLWWIVVAAAAVAMTAGLIAAFRRPQRVPVADDATILTARIAELDSRFAVLGASATDEQRRAYQTERDALKTRLAAALAERPPGP